MTELHSMNFTSVGDQELFSAVSDFVGSTLLPGDRQSEGYTIDFKQEWGEKSLRIVAAFANTFGGIIVVGVSENAGRADEIIGVSSTRELKTLIAGSIAANITPTPDFDIAECTLPSQKDRRLAVVRIRSNGRIHYLLKGDRPVYIRNEDQAIPAPVAELRALFERERSEAGGAWLPQDPYDFFPESFKITRAKGAGTAQERRTQRIYSQSFMRVAIQPRRTLSLGLDYNYEKRFKDYTLAEFSDFKQAVSEGIATENESRNRSSYVYKIHRDDTDLEFAWAILASGTIGFACTLGVQGASLLWSLPDVAANIAGAISLSNEVLKASGYYGEVEITVNVSPGGAVLLTDAAGHDPLLRKSYYPRPWPKVIPQYHRRPIHLESTVSETLNFDERFSRSTEVMTRILNQVLRDMSYAPDLDLLRQSLGKQHQRKP